MPKKPIFEAPVGPSQLVSGLGWNPNNQSMIGNVVCEICGTKHTGTKDEPLSVGTLLDRTYVEKCCGAAVDMVYRQFGEVFAIKMLEDFEVNPTNPLFRAFQGRLYGVMQRSGHKLRDLAQQLSDHFDSFFGPKAKP
ncbi:MAG: hypothetical protein WC528_02720 [Patescibacteria group bacterium]